MNLRVTVTIKMDEKCIECGKGGATPNKLCLACSAKAINLKAKMRTKAGRAVQARWQSIRTKPEAGTDA